MRDDGYVDAYNEHCYGRWLLASAHFEHRPSLRREWRRRLRAATTVVVAALTVAGLTIALPQAAVAASHPRLAPPPNTIHHTRTIGTIRSIPETCGPVPPPSPPSPSINSLAFVAEPSVNEVQALDEATGALVGTPITVGTAPEGVAYWRPPASSSQDPEVVATNSGSHSVTVIDAVTSSVIATVSVPGGSGAWFTAASPTKPYALAVDVLSGKVSVIDLANDTDAGEITLPSAGSSVLSGIAFSASGQYAYVTDASQHKIFVLDYTGGSAPYYALDSTYTNSSYDFSGITSDLSATSSTTFLVTDAQASGYLLKFTVAGTLSAPTQVKHFNSPSETPGAVAVTPGGSNAWVALTGTTSADDVVVSSGSTASYTVNSSFSGVGDLALSADGSTLMTADTGSGTIQETSATSGSATNSTSTDADVSSIAPALATPGAWNAYVTAGSDVDVVNTATQTLTQSIADTDGPIALAASPDGRYVYVANQSTPSISIIETSLVGTTTNPIIATFSIPQGSESNAPIPDSIAVNPQGTALLVGDSANGAVDVIDMNSGDSQYKTVVERIGLFGSGIGSSATPEGITVGPQGTYAYVTEGSSTTSTDGVAVLQSTSSTTTGYTFLADNEALSQGSDTMYAPQQITINPSGENAYVEGFYSSGDPNVVFTFPIGTNGELSNGTGSPVGIGYDSAGLTFSPEDQSLFATSTTSYEYSSISIPSNSVTYNSATDDSGPGAIAVSSDGLYVAVGETAICGHGHDGVGLYDAGSGTELGSPVSLSSSPQSIAFAPQSSPQAVSTSELVAGAGNPAEAAVSSGMNDVVTSGTPSDAPGATAGVDTATGAYSLSLDSMDIPDIGIGLDQTANYDSSRASSVGLLGHGWISTYEMTASQNAHDATTNPCAIVVTQEDGATVTFFPSAEGPYTTCPTSGYQSRGWAQATMTFQSSCNGSDACYVMTRDATTKYLIDETTGELVEIEDLNGNTVTVTWGPHSACSGATSTEPCQVTAADGIRTFTYSYPSPGSGTCPSSAASASS
jgi:YVTN family beta-propeller protein